MLNAMIRLLFGDTRKRNFNRVKDLVDQVNAWDEKFSSISDDELRGKTEDFRRRLAEGATLDDLLPEAYGAVKQACRRLLGESWEAGGNIITWDMVPFDVQVCGAIYLHRGFIAEMATGEGKTLVAAMPLYLNALEGKGAHLVTVNDYLARRDAEWMGKIYQRLGMTVGVILTNMTPEQRRQAYHCDITYGTNNEFGFDYLRDNMAQHVSHLVQREHQYAIVDEVDSVLIDEARTPLIISGQVDRSTHRFEHIKGLVFQLVQKQNTFVNNLVAEAEKLLAESENEPQGETRYKAGERLLQARMGSPKHRRLMKILGEGSIQRLLDRVEADYMRDKRLKELEEELFFVVDERGHSIDLTEKGRTTISPGNPDLYMLSDIVEEFAAIEQRELSEEEKDRLKEEAMTAHETRAEELHNISQLLRAYILYEKDREYVVQDNKVIIVDEFTGRMMPGRRWSDGLHQAVETKEGVTIEKETQTLATITLQNYFRMYGKLAGMTGTAETEAAEFAHIYGMNVAVIPTHKPLRRVDDNDLIYRSQREKYNALVQEVVRLNEYQLPVLVGTTSVDVSEKLSIMLRRQKISHSVLNAKYHEREAQIVRQAGQGGSVTIATNMAGRGTDIKLGPGVMRCKREDGTDKYCSACPNRPPEGKIDPDLPPCGLQIIGSERHEARRIDRQLMGRAGRQGDPGSSRFFVSLEDDLMRLFASERMANLMSRGFEEGEAMSHRLATRAIASAQKKIEGINFEQRKRTLDYDNVMNKQRETIYGIRRQTLTDEGSLHDLVQAFTAEALSNEWPVYCPGNNENEWNVKGFLDWVRRSVIGIQLQDVSDPTSAELELWLQSILERCMDAYRRKTEVLGDGLVGMLSRVVSLDIIDRHWRDHLLAIDELRQGIGLRGYGQQDPLTEYQREATNLFEELLTNIHREIFEKIYRATIVHEPTTGVSRMALLKEEGRQSAADAVRHSAPPAQSQQEAGGNGADGGAAARPQAGPAPRRVTTYRRTQPKVGPNEPCPCGSGKKYKKMLRHSRRARGIGQSLTGRWAVKDPEITDRIGAQLPSGAENEPLLQRDVFHAVHFGDLHLWRIGTDLDLRLKRLLGLTNLLLRRGKRFPELVARAVIERIDQEQADFIFFTGDLTTTSLRSEFDQGMRLLRPLLEHFGDRLIAIPGNHDIYTANVRRLRPFERHFACETRLNPFSVDLNSHWTLVGIDMSVPRRITSRGMVGPDLLKRLNALLQRQRERGRRVLAIGHYPLIYPMGLNVSWQHQLPERRTVLELLRLHKVDVYLHGHQHQRWLMQVDGMLHLNCGSAGMLGRRREKRPGFLSLQFTPETIERSLAVWLHEEYELTRQPRWSSQPLAPLPSERMQH